MDLAERLGRFYTKWVGGPLGKLEVEYEGKIAAEDTGVLTAAIIKGLLEPIVETRVNLVNAVAAGANARVGHFRTQDATGGTLRKHDHASRASAACRARSCTTSRILCNWTATGWILSRNGYVMLTRHRDRPGMIGKVGTLLGAADVNIASMQVARDGPRGEAIMVLTLDDPVPQRSDGKNLSRIGYSVEQGAGFVNDDRPSTADDNLSAQSAVCRH